MAKTPKLPNTPAAEPISEFDVADHLNSEETPSHTLHQVAVQHPGHDNFNSLAEHANTSEATLKHMHSQLPHLNLDEDEHNALSNKIALHPNAPQALVHNEFSKLDPNSYDDSKDKAMVLHPKIDPKVRDRFVRAVMSKDHTGDDSDWDSQYAQRDLATSYVGHPDSNPEVARELLNHPDKEIASRMLYHKGLTDQDHVNFMKRPDFEPSDLDEMAKMPHLSTDTIRAGWDKIRDHQVTDHWSDNNPDNVKGRLLSHPNVPPEMLKEAINQPDSVDEDGNSSYEHGGEDDHRTTALKNPNTDKNLVAALAANPKDRHAHWAAVNRPDTDESTLRNLNDQYRDHSKYSSSIADKIVQHPNVPQDILMQKAQGSTEEARALLKRKDLPEPVLKELVMNKNKNVAMDALNHKSVTPDVVQTAYKRKAADVSRAAAQHPLASDAMKYEKAFQDPEAAKEAVKSATDPNLIKQLHEKFKDSNDKDFDKRLINNENTPSDVLSHIAKQQFARHDAAEQSWGKRDALSSDLARHPNLDEATRRGFMQRNPTATMGNPSLTPDEIKDGLDNAPSDERKYVAAKALEHDNLTPELAKKILTGGYGQVDNVDLEHAHVAPHIFNKDVIHSVLGTNTPEFVNPDHVKTLAQSDQLDPKEISDYFNKPRPGDGAGEPAQEHYDSMISGLLHNPNAPEGLVQKVLHGRGDSQYSNPDVVKAAIKSPHATDEDIQKFYQDHYGGYNDTYVPGLHHEDKKGVSETLADNVLDRGLHEDAARTARDPDLIRHMNENLSDYSTSDREKRGQILKAALENPDKNISKFALDEVSPSLSNEQKKALIDPLKDNPEFAQDAYRHMTPEGQKAALDAGQFDKNDPGVIRGMNPETVRNLKITPDMSHGSVDAILNHDGATLDHYRQAIEHSPERARDVLNQIRRDQEIKTGRTRNRRGIAISNRGEKPRIDKNFHGELEKRILDAHPNSSMVAHIASGTKDKDVLSKISSQPDKYGHAFSALADNDNVRQKDLDGMTNFHGPEYSGAMGMLAGHDKASTKLLSHIMKNYPEHQDAVASHPRAASAGILKDLLKNPDMNVRKNIVENEKVPQGVKDEILKDPEIIKKVGDRYLSPEALEQHAKSDDVDLLHKIVNSRKATPETRGKIVDKALSMLKENPETANNLIDDASSHELDDTSKEKIAVMDPDHARKVIQSNGVSNELAHKLIDRYQDDPEKGKVLKSLFHNHDAHDPKLIDRLMDESDFNDKSHDGPSFSDLDSTLSSSSQVQPHHFEKALNILEKERGPAHNYVNGTDEDDTHREAELLRTIAQKGDKNTYSRLMEHPELAAHLLNNKNLSPEDYKKVSDRFLDGAYNPKDHDHQGTIKEMIKHPNVDSETLGKIYDKADPHYAEGTANMILKSPKADASVVKKIYDNMGTPNVLKHPALGADVLQKRLAKVKSGELSDRHIDQIAKNPNYRRSMSEGLDKGERDELDRSLSENFSARSDDLDEVYKEHKNKSTGILKNLIKNPSTSESVAQDMLNSGKFKRKDLYYNPAIGGKLFREDKHPFPSDVPGVKQGNEINKATFRPQSDRVQAVMDKIPEGSYLDWAQFKNDPANKSLAGNPVVQKLFSSAPKQRVTKEHAEQYLNSMPSKDFHVSYSKWDGIQRHSDKNPQLVVQTNAGDALDKKVGSDRKLNGLFRFIQHAQMHEGSHPVNPQTIGWSRVDTSHPDHWFLEEIQSDLNSGLSKEMHDINQKGYGNRLEEFGVTGDEAPKAANDMADLVHGWDKATLQTVMDLAKKHGVKKLSMHSGKSKTIMNKGDRAEVTNKYDKIYNRLPQEFGFQPDKYDNLPHNDKNKELMGHPIWTMDLAGKKPEGQE